MEYTDEQIVQPSTLENIDQSFFNFINEKMNIFSNGTKGWQKVPVIWSSTERVFMSKNDSNLRDKDGTLIKPIICIIRTGMVKDETHRGSFYGNVSNYNSKLFGGYVKVAQRIKQDKTKNFANNDAYKKFGQINYKTKNEKIIYESVYVPAPKYISLSYDVVLESNFMQQMNEMVQPFININGPNKSFNIRNNGHRYECFMKEFNEQSNSKDIQEEERKFEQVIKFEVLGYLMGGDDNTNISKIIKTENAVEIKFPRDFIILEILVLS